MTTAAKITIPADVMNNNCVQDAAARLHEELNRANGRETERVTKARANLESWIAHARR